MTGAIGNLRCDLRATTLAGTTVLFTESREARGHKVGHPGVGIFRVASLACLVRLIYPVMCDQNGLCLDYWPP